MMLIDLPPPPAYVEVIATMPSFYQGTQILGAIKIHRNTNNYTYDTLPYTQEDVVKIHNLITTTGAGNWKKLWSERKRLYKIGDEIRYIHPLKFLGIIYSEPTLKPHMLAICNHYFKRTNFIKDLAKAMNLEIARNNLNKYLDGFSAHVKVPKEIFQPYIDHQDWEGLLRCLAEN